MAAYQARNPADRAVFDHHWNSILTIQIFWFAPLSMKAMLLAPFWSSTETCLRSVFPDIHQVLGQGSDHQRRRCIPR